VDVASLARWWCVSLFAEAYSLLAFESGGVYLMVLFLQNVPAQVIAPFHSVSVILLKSVLSTLCKTLTEAQ
jgi:hypothetical protein